MAEARFQQLAGSGRRACDSTPVFPSAVGTKFARPAISRREISSSPRAQSRHMALGEVQQRRLMLLLAGLLSCWEHRRCCTLRNRAYVLRTCRRAAVQCTTRTVLPSGVHTVWRRRVTQRRKEGAGGASITACKNGLALRPARNNLFPSVAAERQAGCRYFWPRSLYHLRRRRAARSAHRSSRSLSP